MASGDTKTQQYLDIAANGTRADLPGDGCCNTRTQSLILGVAERIMDVEEMQGDTIALLPNMLAMGEVVIWGHRRNMTASIIPKPSKTDLQLQQAVPQGFNPLGLLFLGFDQLWGKKMRHSKAAKEQKKKMIIENY